MSAIIRSNSSSPILESSKDKIFFKKSDSSSSGDNNNQSIKRRSTWRNLLTPSYKSRSDEFHKLFCDEIPTSERLIADYACALHREILIQGRVYISVNYIVFHANLFGWVTKLVVRLRDISEIYKANTARIIPNAIQIIMTSGDKHVFASFVARDKSYVMMLRIWQNNLMNERMTDQEIRDLVYFSYGRDLGMGDNEELNINSPDPVTPTGVPMDYQTKSPEPELRVEQEQQSTTYCGCEEHRGLLIADQEFEINIDTLFTLIFTNSKFMRTYMIRRGMKDTIISGWKRLNNNGDKSNFSTPSSVSCQDICKTSGEVSQIVRSKQVRQLNYSMNLDHIWAKQVQVEERQNICKVKPGIYVLKSQTINSGVPYGESFTVDISYCLTRNGDINKSRMLIHGYVNFDKDKHNWKLAMIKSVIEKQSIQGVKDFIEDLTNCIKEYIQKTLEGSQNDEIMKAVDNQRVSSRKGSSVQNVHRGHFRHGSLVRAKSKLKERKLRSMYRYYIHDTEDVEGGSFYHFDANNRSNSESSLASFGSIDDNGSMMMMVDATDDQLSENVSEDELSFQDDECRTNVGSLDRSFSDVDSNKRSIFKRQSRSAEASNWRTSKVPTTKRSKRSGGGQSKGGRGLGCLSGSNKTQQFQWSRPVSIEFGDFRIGSINPINVACFMIVTLLIVLFSMIVSHVMILRRLDSIEQRVRDQCEQILANALQLKSNNKDKK